MRFFRKKSMEPFIIIGLGNPGREYENTRHNIGSLALDKIGRQWGIDISRLRYKSLTGEGKFGGKRVILVKPQTYMNRSGQAVGSFLRFYKTGLENLLVIHDDLDLPFGSIRLRENGGSGGQRGMESIISHLGSPNFARLRLGIGRPPGRMDPADYVLKKFSKSEQFDLELVLNSACDAVETLLRENIEKAMTRFNHSVLDDE